MTKQHAIYTRVSTRRQDTANQEPELRRWAESHEGDSHWYRDTYTGTSRDRPGFRQMMRDIESGAWIRWWSGGWTGWGGRPGA